MRAKVPPKASHNPMAVPPKEAFLQYKAANPRAWIKQDKFHGIYTDSHNDAHTVREIARRNKAGTATVRSVMRHFGIHDEEAIQRIRNRRLSEARHVENLKPADAARALEMLADLNITLAQIHEETGIDAAALASLGERTGTRTESQRERIRRRVIASTSRKVPEGRVFSLLTQTGNFFGVDDYRYTLGQVAKSTGLGKARIVAECITTERTFEDNERVQTRERYLRHMGSKRQGAKSPEELYRRMKAQRNIISNVLRGNTVPESAYGDSAMVGMILRTLNLGREISRLERDLALSRQGLHPKGRNEIY